MRDISRSSQPSPPYLIGIWIAARRMPLMAYSGLWVFVSLIPVLNIFGVGRNVFTERYLYLPSIGFCLLVTDGAGCGAAAAAVGGGAEATGGFGAVFS